MNSMHRAGSSIRRRLPIAVTAITLLLCARVEAQMVAYSHAFDRAERPYTELTAPTVFANDWEGGQFLINPGDYTFRFFGNEVNFTDPGNYLAVNGTGMILILSDTTQFSYPGFLAELTSRDEGSSISYGVQMVGEDTVLVVQWKNAGFLRGDAANYVNFQMWFYNRTGVIEYHYGPSRIVGTEAFIGQDGPPIGLLMSDRGMKTWFIGSFLSGTPADPIFIDDVFFPPFGGVPAPNTVYRFTPFETASVAETESAASSDLRAYPSDVRDHVTLEAGERFWSAGARATVHDLLGRTVRELALEARTSTIDLSDLPSGAYWIDVVSRAGRRAVMIRKQ